MIANSNIERSIRPERRNGAPSGWGKLFELANPSSNEGHPDKKRP
jgi:hypothetical protein